MIYPTRSVWAAAAGINVASENRLYRARTLVRNQCAVRPPAGIAVNICPVGSGQAGSAAALLRPPVSPGFVDSGRIYYDRARPTPRRVGG